MYTVNDFLGQYKTLEEWARAKHGVDGIRIIEDKHSNGRVRNEVQYFRRVRNLLTHNPNGDGTPYIELTDDFKARFEVLCDKLMSSAAQIAVPYKDIYKREISDKVMPTIAHMKEKVYSHVPVMNGRKVWGVFSETALFNIVGDGNMALINEETRFLNIGNYIAENTNGEFFDFIGEDATIDDISGKFSEAASSHRRLEMLCITKTGDKNGDLTGLVTIWDMV